MSQVYESSSNDSLKTIYKKALLSQMGSWTPEKLGIDLEEIMPSSKKNSDNSVKNVRCRVKK